MTINRLLVSVCYSHGHWRVSSLLSLSKLFSVLQLKLLSVINTWESDWTLDSPLTSKLKVKSDFCIKTNHASLLLVVRPLYNLQFCLHLIMVIVYTVYAFDSVSRCIMHHHSWWIPHSPLHLIWKGGMGLINRQKGALLQQLLCSLQMEWSQSILKYLLFHL